RTNGLRPHHLEQAFGTAAPGAWPAVTIQVEDAALRFRGHIDRIDLDPEGRHAFLFDYKTGSAAAYQGLAADPVLAGRHVQLALYTRAARAVLGDAVAVDGAYWFVTSKGSFQQLSLPADRASVEGRLDHALAIIASGVRRGAF